MTFYRRLPQFDYLKPKTIEETIALLVKRGEKAQVMAGGTDLIPWLKKREKTAALRNRSQGIAGVWSVSRAARPEA